VLVEVEVAPVANLEHRRLLPDVRQALILVVEVDVDVEFTAEPALVAKRTGEVQYRSVPESSPQAGRAVLIRQL